MKRPDLDGSLILLACGNDDKFHSGNGHFLYAIIVDGEVTMNPNRYEAETIVRAHPNTPAMVVIWPCPSCRKRGVRGPTMHFDIPNLVTELEDNTDED